jgi:hypothetical protein
MGGSAAPGAPGGGSGACGASGGGGGGTTPGAGAWVTEGALEAQMRMSASTTPRLPPLLLARTPASAVRLARAAARSFTQKFLIDTGAPMTTGLLFHP